MQRAESAAPDTGISLAQLLAAFSLATDLGLGQPMEHLLRAWRIAVRLANRLGTVPEAGATLFYVAVLSWVGCVADTAEVARWFGDDIAFRADSFQVDFTGLAALGMTLSHAGAGGSPLHRARLATTLLATAGRPVQQGLMSHCVSTSQMAGRLGLGPEVCHPLEQFFTRWDGKGVPSDVEGEQITSSMRIFHLADVVEVWHRAQGIDAALEVARSRRGTQFDPAVVDAFCASAAEVLEGDDPGDWQDLIRGDVSLARPLAAAALDDVLLTVADFIDLRSPCRAGHSRAVAQLAASAANVAGLPGSDVTAVRRAALVHDIGLTGVPATILDKPGPLTATEAERMRLHAYYTERVLSRPEALARFGGLAAMVRERCDGSGYHRGLAGSAIPAAARVLVAADVFRAATEPRPHRPALSVPDATRLLQTEVRAGRLAPEAVEAVLVAAGRRRPRKRTGPAGLTAREIEVLVLIARGASNRDVSRALGISAKTAASHVEHIYAKSGATTRSTATLFAVQHGLLDPAEWDPSARS